MIGRTAKTVIRASRQQVRPPRRVCPFCFEGDHIGGRNHIPHVIVDECQLHHSWLTEERLAAGAEMKKQDHPIKSVEMVLRSLAVSGGDFRRSTSDQNSRAPVVWHSRATSRLASRQC
jgi:hypothetical protein